MAKVHAIPVTVSNRDQGAFGLTDNGISHLLRTITDIFEEQVKRTPNAVAVIFEGREFTYNELNQRSNQLGHFLQSLGAGPGSRVGICVERSLEMVVGLLGILKAGAAYVPLDGNYPLERLSFMVEDADVEILLAQKKLAAKIPASKAKLVFLDTEWEMIARQSWENPLSGNTADHPAYIIYTSGSTGRPKGVCICHRNAVRLVQKTNYAELSVDQVFLQFVSISFDVAAFEIWGALLNGARLLVFPAYTPSVEELGERIAQYQVTTLWLTSGLFHQMVENDTGQHFRGLRQLLAGGDVLSLRLVRRFLKQYPRCRLINGYGPTENGTFSTCGELREMPADAASVTIGTPIANSTAYVLDEEMQAVPAGETGELYLGGHGLAHGYWRQPAMTAAKFVPNPFAGTPGERLYRTGDLGRYLPDGTLEFLGRIDQQVKLRGYRIELGEIEAVLEQHPAVSHAVVLVREDNPGDRRLVAYVIEHGDPIRVSELREYLSQKLPEYMVPSALVLMETFPLTANGKVDRRSLPPPAGERPTLKQAYVAPATATEKLLSNVWVEVLHIDRVGGQDDFFDLGGNSLLAAQVISRVGKTYDVHLPLRSFFEQPVLAALAQSFEAARRETSETGASAIGAVLRGEEIPLGLSQERVWFLQQLDPSSIAYHFQATLRISGPLDVQALERSLTQMVKRHEILRTTFIEKDGRALQVIHEPVPASLAVVHLEEVEKDSLHEATERLIQDEMARRFDVSRLPLIRWVLLAFSGQEHLLLHLEHHFVHDGWSFNLFLGELLQLYKAFAKGQANPLAPPRFQFADFAVWQREYVCSDEVQAQLSYWKKKLDGSPPISELPTDHPRSSVQTFHGGLLRILLPQELAGKLRAFGNREDASLFVIMMSAFFALAYTYTRQADFCVGASLANRQRPETEGLLGMLVNNVVMRAQMPESASFRDLLAHVRELTLGAYENQDVPFQDVVKSLIVNRDLSVNPLFQTTFNFHNSPVSVPEIPELKLKLEEALGNGAAKFDLGVIVIPASGQRLRLNPEWDKDAVTMLWEYNTDLFTESTIRRMIGYYQQILQIMMADANQRVAETGLLTEEEHRQVLVNWNQTNRDFPSHRSVHQWFEQQARQTPDFPAVTHRQQRLSYQELNGRANQLARHLRRKGIGPEASVGMCMERCPEMIVAMLGILKAGGAYVPLDMNYPRARLQYMIQDAHLELILTQEKVQTKLAETEESWICLDSLWSEIAKESEEEFESGAEAENLAYIIYTSGSTGNPKGVGVPHRALLNLVAWHQDSYNVNVADRATQVAAQAFDASVWEVWPYLLSGSCIDLPETEVLEKPARLFEWLAAREITISFLPTPLAESLAYTTLPAGLKLRALLTGGDRLHQANWSEFPFRIINHYGPTENTVVTTCAPAISGNTPPIGKPIANTRVYVLDDNFEPVAIGVPGELYAGGRSLARGYVNRPALTAEKFVPDPWSSVPGERLYKTGDIVRYLADGNLEFIGRKDQQVKLRGYRIELGEIEATLLAHPEVKHAVVTLREESGRERRLVAYVVANDKSVTGDELRAFLQQKLPGYMVPTAYVELNELPLTANGKVDRKALPAPELSGRAHREPRSPQEELLCGIFAQVLSLERVGIDDDFFALGGHSLLATRVVSQVRGVLGMDLPVSAVFNAPTVAELSSYLASNGHSPLRNAVAYADASAIKRK